MSRIACKLFLLLCVSFPVFPRVDVILEGRFKVIWGINLDALASGFKNENSSEISFTLPGGDCEKGGGENIGAYIKFEEWDAGYSDEEGWQFFPGELKAKIIGPGIWVEISGTNAEIGSVTIVEGMDKEETRDEGIGTSLDYSGGLVFGMEAGPATVELGLFSTDIFVNAESITGPAFGASVLADINIGPVTFREGILMGLTYPPGSPFSTTAKLSLSTTDYSFYAGIDAEIIETTVWETGAGFSVRLQDGLNFSADASFSEFDNLDIKTALIFSEVLPGLNFGLVARGVNLLIVPVWTLEVETSTASLPVTFTTAAGYSLDVEGPLNMSAGMKFPLNENTAFALAYTSENFLHSFGSLCVISEIIY